MTPIITKAGDHFVIYLVPNRAAHERNLSETHGRSFDPVERKWIEGGLPLLWKRVPATFPTREAALASLRVAA